MLTGNLQIHPDWKQFLTEEILEQLGKIAGQISVSGFTPSEQKVLRFLTRPLLSAKIIILGQDPYPQPGVATGRAFEVGGLRSWNEPFSNISIKNIHRAIYKAYTNRIIPFSGLRTLYDNEFPMLGPSRLFIYWEEQGVLLLNTSLTCEPGKPGSHQKIWEEFSKRLLSYIHVKNPEIIWFLWGNDAGKAVEHLTGINSVASFHPMMCFDGPGREIDFLYGKNNCFALTLGMVDWTGFGPAKNSRVQDTLF